MKLKVALKCKANYEEEKEQDSAGEKQQMMENAHCY